MILLWDLTEKVKLFLIWLKTVFIQSYPKANLAKLNLIHSNLDYKEL